MGIRLGIGLLMWSLAQVTPFKACCLSHEAKESLMLRITSVTKTVFLQHFPVHTLSCLWKIPLISPLSDGFSFLLC